MNLDLQCAAGTNLIGLIDLIYVGCMKVVNA
jgi:hypothetical protein